MRPALLLALLLVPLHASAGHVLEVGTGWQNMGASRETKWLPGLQGSRKDVPLYLGWRLVGQRRLYWAPGARLHYTNFWSIGGAGNLLGVSLAPAGIGVHLARPPSRIAPDARRGRWFVTLELQASVQVGGNVTPTRPRDPSIPDPDRYRAQLKEELERGSADLLSLNQRYPHGRYEYVSLGFPLQLRAWYMARAGVGVGLFVELNLAIAEWNLAGPSVPAYGYHISGGGSVALF